MKFYLAQLLHNAIAHPLLGLLGCPAPAWALRFHDWTAELAWPGHVRSCPGSDWDPERLDVPLAIIEDDGDPT